MTVIHMLSPPCCSWHGLRDALEGAGHSCFVYSTETANHARALQTFVAKLPDPTHVVLWLAVNRHDWTERATAESLCMASDLGYKGFDELLDKSLLHALRVIAGLRLRLTVVPERDLRESGQETAGSVLEWLGAGVPA